MIIFDYILESNHIYQYDNKDQQQRSYAIKMQTNQQGFEENQQYRLTSKLGKYASQRKQIDTFYVIPEAKPILGKNYVDMSKPKVLIKQIDMFLEPQELLSSNLRNDAFQANRPHKSQLPLPSNLPKKTIWDKYIQSQLYTMIYLKFYKESIIQLQNKGFRRFKSQLQKMCRNQNLLFATYLIDLSFLSDAGTYLMRNLKPITFEQKSVEQFQGNIQFDSRFQCGNLFAVFEKKITTPQIYQYDLVLQSDINTKGFSNWFYFNVKNKSIKTIKFNIVNIQKKFALFSEGMKVAVFSMQKLKHQGIQWHRDGYGYSYYRNQLRKSNQNQNTYYTLSFQYNFKYENDVVYFAANLPYSYSKMLKFIDSMEKLAKLNSSIYFKKQNKVMSISSNICPIISLTWKRDKKKEQKSKRKKIIGVIARQHPCQTISSYIMEGFIKQLIYLNSEQTIWLLQNYIFKIVPMVNVDGVIYGNSRCDISGSDINRKWTKFPNKFIYPIISQVRNIFLSANQQQLQIDYFIDLHGHSRKMGSFIYGCKSYDQIESRQFAWIMNNLNSHFLFQQSLFHLAPSMKATARGSMSQLVQRKKSMTLETSFFGYDSSLQKKHFEVSDLQKLGSTLVEALYICCSKDKQIFHEQQINNQITEYLQSSKKSKKQKEDNQSCSSDSCSDKNPAEDQMTDLQKAQHFLTPATAVKVGLAEISVLKIGKKVTTPPAVKEKLQLIVNKNSQIFTAYDEMYQGQKSPKQRNVILRPAKSVTKIEPFKFSQKRIRSIASLQKQKIVPIEVILKLPQKKIQIDRPQPKKKSDFWGNFKKEYQILLTQRRIER